MTAEVTDTFHVTELFLLSSAFKAHGLFGLPDKKIYQLGGDTLFQEANEALIQKEVLTVDGGITPGGLHVVNTLEDYYNSNKYVRINNLMFAYKQKDADEVIVLVEYEKENYRLLVMSKIDVLKLLLDRFPFLQREPEEAEKTWLKTKLSNETKGKLENSSMDEAAMNLESFHISSKSNITYNQWFIFEHENQIIIIDTVAKEYFHVSQYWLMKLLFDEMDFPYKAGGGIQWSVN